MTFLSLARFMGRRKRQIPTDISSDLTATTGALSSEGAIRYLGQVSDLRAYTPGERGIVMGDLVVMGLDQTPPGFDFIPQSRRPSRRHDFSLPALKADPTILHSSIHSVFAHYLENTPRKDRRNIVLASDAILALGAKYTKGISIICNGYANSEQTYFDIYVFRFGQLILISENRVKPPEHIRFEVEIRGVLDSVLAEFPEAQRIVWTPPLPPLNQVSGLPPVEIVGPEIYFRKLPPVSLEGQENKSGQLVPYLAALAVFIGAGGLVISDTLAFSGAKAAYQRLTQNAQAPTTPLEILQARADWQRKLDGDAAQGGTLKQLEMLLAAVAKHPDWRVIELALDTRRGDSNTQPNPTAAPAEKAPIYLVLSIPAGVNSSALDQAQPIVAALREETGFPLYVAQQGLHEPKDGFLRIDIATE